MTPIYQQLEQAILTSLTLIQGLIIELILNMKNILFYAYIAYIINIVNTTSVPKVDTSNPEYH